jgi:hypothetical protein
MSCNSGPEKINPGDKELPAALQDDRPGISSFKRSSGDIIDDLYQEAINKSATLLSLEAAIKHYENEYINLEDSFQDYDKKSVSYYQSAGLIANGISDSLLRKTVLNFIDASRLKYNRKKGELMEAREAVNEKDSAINDRYRLLKILLTYSMIENYQNQKLPSVIPFKNFQSKQDSILDAIKKATPQL